MNRFTATEFALLVGLCFGILISAMSALQHMGNMSTTEAQAKCEQTSTRATCAYALRD